MKRRTFNKSMILIGGQAMAAPYISPDLSNRGLKKNDAIGLIAPGSAISSRQKDIAIKQVEQMGFKAKVGKHLSDKWGYLAGKDEDRLSDLHDMYKDQDVKAIWCVRGGYGCTRLLDKIDYDLVRRNPKPIIGYSDITALLLAFYNKHGKAGYHGPLAGSEMNEYSFDSFQNTVVQPKNSLLVINTDSKAYNEKNYDDLYIIRKGTASGPLIGGNLSLLAAMAGTSYSMSLANTLVFIEEIGEDPYRVDRMLTQLLQANDLAYANGIILGQFKNCSSDNPNRSLTLKECLNDRLGNLDIPVIFGMSFGHVEDNFTIPFGAKATMDTTSKSLKISDAHWEV